MRILHVQNQLAIGGTDTLLLQLAREQKRMGHNVTICCMFGEAPLDARAAEYGIPVVHLHCRGGRLAKIKALYTYLGTAHYDVLNSHWAVWLATAVAGFLRRTPRIHTHHSNQPRRLFPEHRVASFFTTKVVILTPYVEPYIAKYVAVPKRKLVVIPNGIDFADVEAGIRVEIEGIPRSSPVVGMLARLSPPKDYPTLMQAAKIVTAKIPDVHFIGIGGGPQQKQFEQQAADLGLTNFHYLGPRLDVPDILRRMTIDVLATSLEGHPLSLVEAMVSGCACIGSDIPSVRFTLDDGNAGLLVPGRNPSALAEAIISLLEDPGLHERLTTQAREYAKRFHVSRMAQDYINLYTSVISK